MQPRSRRLILSAAALAWCGLVGIGLRELHAHATTEGARHQTPLAWPVDSSLLRDGVTVALFLHPECPCSRASIAELATVLVASKTTPKLLVVLAGDSTERLTTSLRTLPSATIIRDHDEREANRFGAKTSGHVVVYDARGVLAFSGGITGSRGHTGDNVGRRSLASALAGETPIDAARAVFGCTLEARR